MTFLSKRTFERYSYSWTRVQNYKWSHSEAVTHNGFISGPLKQCFQTCWMEKKEILWCLLKRQVPRSHPRLPETDLPREVWKSSVSVCELWLHAGLTQGIQ